jgi:hypothetical protein
LKETVGNALLPVLNKLAGWFTTAATWMNKHQGLVRGLAIAFGVVLVAAIGAAIVAWVALNLAFVATPIGALITGVLAIGVAVVIAYKKFQTFRDIVNIVGQVIATWAKVNIAIFQKVIQGIRILAAAFLSVLLKPVLMVFSAILHGAALAFGWVPGVGGKLRKARDAFDKFRDEVNRIIDDIRQPKPPRLSTAQFAADVARYKRLYNSLMLPSVTNYVTTVFTNQGSPFGPRRAAGGPVAPGTVYTVGERGPELFMPNQPGTIIPNNRLSSGAGGGGVGGGNVYINVENVNGVQTTSELMQALQKYAKRNGSIKLSGVTA